MGGGIDQSVSPGIGGFLAFFFLAIALWLLMRNMNSRLRNVRYLEEAEDERRGQEAQQIVVSRPPTPKPGQSPAAAEVDEVVEVDEVDEVEKKDGRGTSEENQAAE
ncbi:hypothetical protein [Gephyromycinifex aptenodytis]|uniref:hypothetical protein n=1 Tax=Gephyromycinifex aptenodytis TaxID=2716227 RepID=UPI0014459B33|nr:hypothetical protein [Gephyromycinifex aptenodytis]